MAVSVLSSNLSTLPFSVSGGPDADGIATGGGDDTVDARDNVRDRVYCGSGSDTVYADPIDILRGCEKVVLDAPPSKRGVKPSAP